LTYNELHNNFWRESLGIDRRCWTLICSTNSLKYNRSQIKFCLKQAASLGNDMGRWTLNRSVGFSHITFNGICSIGLRKKI